MSRNILKSLPQVRGFTLIEVIATIIAAGILAAFFVNFMGTAMSRASDSVARVRSESAGQAAVEQIIADYVTAMNSNPSGALGLITANVDNGSYNTAGIHVNWAYIEFDQATGDEVAPPPVAGDKLKITVRADNGNDQVFLLGQSRTAGDQPYIRF